MGGMTDAEQDRLLESNYQRLTKVWEILTGNGNPKTGLVYKVEFLRTLLYIVIVLTAGDGVLRVVSLVS